MMKLLSVIALVALVGCVSSDRLEHFTLEDGTKQAFRVKKTDLIGLTVYGKSEQVYTKEQLDTMNESVIATAEATAKAETALFNIKTKQQREKTKQSVSKFVAYGAFAGVLIAIIMGAFTKGWVVWGTIAGGFFVMGATSLVLPELSTWLKWAIILAAGIAIAKGLSHTKDFSILNIIAKKKE